jgi:putative addiction module component (TIGR02574 family)
MRCSVRLNDQAAEDFVDIVLCVWVWTPQHPVLQIVNAKTECNLSVMLLERLPEVQSLSVEDKWRLINELWSDLAQVADRAGVDENTVALLNQRFEEYVQDPGLAQPLDACLARLAERKRQWK